VRHASAARKCGTQIISLLTLPVFVLLLGVWSTEAQSQQVTEKKVVVVMAEFSDAATNNDARGSRGRTGESTFEEFKYRYRDYHDIFFQEEGQVVHPDASLDAEFSEQGIGWYQYGSFTRYIHDNSFGLWEIVPMEVDAANDQYGILNTVDYDGDPELRNAKINWLQIDMTKPSSGSIHTNRDIADAAFEEMKAILPQNWDWQDVDAVMIIYAGGRISGAGGWTETVDVGGVDVTTSVSSERRSGCFDGPNVWFHELVHAVTGSKVDLYEDHTGRYSLMGASVMNTYTPSLLDPWLRITLGWLDVEVYDAAGEWTNVELPKVNARDNGNLPWVLVVPISGDNPATSGWSYTDKSYLIVENRRIEGWDRQLNRDDNKQSATYGDEIAGIDGGFLVWGAGTLAPGRLRPYEADGDYEINFSSVNCGDPYDFFPFGGAQFGVWTRPGLVDRWDDLPVSCENRRTRNVFMSFPQYTTTTNRNSIGRLILDRLVVEDHTYDSSPLADISATKYNNQQKTCWFDGKLHLAFNVNGIAYVARSSDAGSSWRDLFVMTPIYGNGNLRQHGNDDNVSLTATSNDVWVLIEERDAYYNSYLVRRQLNPDECEYNRQQMSAASGSALRPSIAALDDFIVYVTPHNTGIGSDPAGLYAWQSTNGGNDWTGPVFLDGTDGSSSRNPSVSVRKVDNGLGQFDYYYDVVFQYLHSAVRWYSSATATTSNVASTIGRIEAPHHIEHDAILDIVGVGEKIPDQESEYAINFLRLKTSGGYYQQPVNLMHTDDNILVKRDSRIVTYEDADGVKHLITWVEGDGASMYFADNHDDPDDWLKIHRSSFTLIPSMTSYPLAIEGANGEPMIASTVISNALAWPLSLWQIEVKTRAQDIADHAVLLDLVTGKTVTLESNGLRQELRHEQPTVHDGVGQEIGSVRYAFDAPLMYWNYAGGTPFDTLTTTEEVTLVGEENVRYAIRVVSDTIPDTTFVEGYLYDHALGDMISTSGEYRIPPGVLDTTLILGLELPNGVPMATVRIHTKAWRGLMDPLNPCDLTLSRDHFGSEPVPPKVRSREVRPIAGSRDALQLYPTESRAGGVLTMTLPFSGPVTVRIHSMLGQEVTRIELESAEKDMHIPLRLPILRPGMYVVSATGAVGMRTSRILVQ
jgi:hypothetical protein